MLIPNLGLRKKKDFTVSNLNLCYSVVSVIWIQLTFTLYVSINKHGFVNWFFGGIIFFPFFYFVILHLLTCVYVVWATSCRPFPVEPVPHPSSLILLKRKHRR
jgi:hypothetical protein